MEVFAALRRHPTAGAGLLVAAAWIVVVAFECFTTHPLDRGGAYADLVQVASYAGPGVFGVAAFTWLLERAGIVALAALVRWVERAFADHSA